MSQQDMALMAHLLRRAGFGATRQELEGYLTKGYEATVEELLNPGDAQSMPDDVIRRYHTDMAEMRELYSVASYWMYRMITTRCPLEEKLALFWHGLFATGYSKLNQARSLLNQIEMFRRQALGPLPDFLLELSKDPAMIIWLDNNDNHKDAINENYGRELLELFSMGIGNYTEDDVKECARAFTGWTLGNAEYMATRASKDSIWPYSRMLGISNTATTTTMTPRKPSWVKPAILMARTSSTSSPSRKPPRASSVPACSNFSLRTRWTRTASR
ncbi:MAG: hypothetical protein ETSY1_20180 [Candidatus Entotheonella factor]|uniref:DUF1800 domain-containing protein n=1 Tax=Entotheonella factor TaxID=1429438 RepID=W4LK53_ENTF1|nr:MAG: hypothetical protein ETSY1_20180 [Candidatus Entotheonella factor]